MSLRAILLSLVTAATASAPAVAQNTNVAPIFHVAIFRFDRAHLDTAMQAFHALAAATRREPGNVGYDIYRGIDDPQAFYVVERWASRNALADHERTEAFLKYGIGVLTRFGTLHDTVTGQAFDVSG
jgi:quinol monooxygenase YgiN